jgi:hypothetical protein
MQCSEVCLFKKTAFGREICLLYSFLIEYLKSIVCCCEQKVHLIGYIERLGKSKASECIERK